MITLFTIPKPFHGHFDVIQRNAIRSWQRLPDQPEIIVFGTDAGTAEAARELGVRHEPEIARNPEGTPLVNDLFARAQRLASNDVLCYVNADIILLKSFVAAIDRLASQAGFLMVGQRWNLDLDRPLEFDQPDWDQKLLALVRQRGVLYGKSGIDFFAFRRGLFQDLPAFAVGRTVWDNWLLYRARAMGARLIDATAVVDAIHQNHDYSHHRQGTEGVWRGAEAQRNRALAGGYERIWTIADASHVLTASRLKPNLSRERLRRVVGRSAWLPPIVRRPLRALRQRWQNPELKGTIVW